jgi:nitrate reductase gamma subunit
VFCEWKKPGIAEGSHARAKRKPVRTTSKIGDDSIIFLLALSIENGNNMMIFVELAKSL